MKLEQRRPQLQPGSAARPSAAPSSFPAPEAGAILSSSGRAGQRLEPGTAKPRTLAPSEAASERAKSRSLPPFPSLQLRPPAPLLLACFLSLTGAKPQRWPPAKKEQQKPKAGPVVVVLVPGAGKGEAEEKGGGLCGELLSRLKNGNGKPGRPRLASPPEATQAERTRREGTRLEARKRGWREMQRRSPTSRERSSPRLIRGRGHRPPALGPAQSARGSHLPRAPPFGTFSPPR